VLAVKSELTHYLTSRQIEEKLKMQEEKPLINHQCITKCNSCDADNIGYTRHHLHQSIEEHTSSVIGKHMKEVYDVKLADLVEVFSVLKEYRGKLDCVIQEMLFIRERKWRFATPSRHSGFVSKYSPRERSKHIFLSPCFTEGVRKRVLGEQTSVFYLLYGFIMFF